MSGDRLYSIVSRVLFSAAFLLLGIAIVEKVSNLFGYTFLRGTYTPGRLLEIAVIFLVFVLSLLLRQIREELRKRSV